RHSDGCDYVAVPVDLGGSTTLHWDIDPKTRQLDLGFDFHDSELNAFFDFVQNGHALEARSISQAIIEESERLLMAKMERRGSPLRAILGAYVLLRANELERMDTWTGNLLRWFDWLPDARAVRIEYLARNGRHAEALALMLEVRRRGAPWFRSGVGYLQERAKLYARAAAGKSSSLQVADDDVRRIGRIAEIFGKLVSALDMTHITTALRGMERVD